MEDHEEVLAQLEPVALQVLITAIIFIMILFIIVFMISRLLR